LTGRRSPCGRSSCHTSPCGVWRRGIPTSDNISLAVGDGARRMTYAELAAVWGTSQASAQRLVRRKHWPRQVGNDGVVRVLVPLDEARKRRETLVKGQGLSAPGPSAPSKVPSRSCGRPLQTCDSASTGNVTASTSCTPPLPMPSPPSGSPPARQPFCVQSSPDCAPARGGDGGSGDRVMSRPRVTLLRDDGPPEWVGTLRSSATVSCCSRRVPARARRSSLGPPRPGWRSRRA